MPTGSAGVHLAATDALGDLSTQFELFADPTENVTRLDDSTPILLLPLRIETRFKELVDGDRTRNQLWVRAYPDDIAVNTFEEVLAEVEVTNARIYWTNIWKAGGDEGAERAAWRSLAISHGPGRAHWIIQQVSPLNAAEEPVVAAGEHLLVIVTDQPLPCGGAPAGARLLDRRVRCSRRPGGDRRRLRRPRRRRRHHRAELIAASYAPQNLATAARGDPRGHHPGRVPRAARPGDDRQPAVAVDARRRHRRAARASGGARLSTATSRPCSTSGARSPPSCRSVPTRRLRRRSRLRVEDGELVVPDPMKWMTDFDVAVDNGMGFRIDLDSIQARARLRPAVRARGADSADPEAGAADLERLITDHQRSRKGFSVLAQGAPTNNVEDDVSGYTWRDDTDLSYDALLRPGPDRTTRTSGATARTAAGWPSYSGSTPTCSSASPNYYGTDQAEAHAMNEALWPATFGYLLDQMMEPVFDDDTIVSTRAWFSRYVVGRGAIPAVRVGRQPYGILPVTPFSRMGWISRKLLANDRIDTGIPDQFRFLDTMYRLIRTADEQWSELAAQVSYVGKPGVDPHQALLDVVGLHPVVGRVLPALRRDRRAAVQPLQALGQRRRLPRRPDRDRVRAERARPDGGARLPARRRRSRARDPQQAVPRPTQPAQGPGDRRRAALGDGADPGLPARRQQLPRSGWSKPPASRTMCCAVRTASSTSGRPRRCCT